MIKERVPIVFTGGGNPLPLFPYFEAAGIKIIPVVPLTRLAKKMEDNNADAVVVEGYESGGHIGENTTFCLVPQTKRLLKRIPLIAAGGIYDGKTALATFILGADGVQMGTRFLVSKECQIHDGYKEAIIKATDEDITVVGRFTGRPVRLINNKLAEQIKKLEEKNPFPEEIKSENIAGSKIISGDVENSPLLAGLVSGGISEIKTCKEIIEDIVKELEKLF